MVTIKTAEDIVKLREGGARHAKIMQTLAALIVPGKRLKELNDSALKLIQEGGDLPSFLNYTPDGASRPYPAALCVSVNDEIAHGIPNESPKILKEGDIVSLDSGIEFEGMFTDAAITVGVGAIDANGKKLLKATREALDAAISAAKPGATTGDIVNAIEKVAKKYKLNPAEDLGGHGVGHSQHEDPFVPNFRMKGKGVELKSGMVLAIEPMLNEGKSKTRFLNDEYTAVTADGSRSAHFEHTIVV